MSAEKVFQEWLQSPHVRLPGTTDIFVSGPAKCSPALWKALACALQFKPCKRNMPQLTICARDCIELLSSCLRERNQTLAMELCDRLTRRNSGECVSLQSYLQPQPDTVAMISPCKYNHCDSEHVCVVDLRSFEGFSCVRGPLQFVLFVDIIITVIIIINMISRHWDLRIAHIFLLLSTGCQFGEMSNMYGYPGSWIELPSSSVDCPINTCNDMCYCNANGELQQCRTLPFRHTESCQKGQQVYGNYMLIYYAQSKAQVVMIKIG